MTEQLACILHYLPLKWFIVSRASGEDSWVSLLTVIRWVYGSEADGLT